MQFSDVPMDEVRGLTVYYETLPVIGINSKGDPSARPFTALHELIHLTLRKSGEESSAGLERRSAGDWQQLETFVDTIAAEVLMPQEAFSREWQSISALPVHRQKEDPKPDDVARPAKCFNVSPHAAATRLEILGQISWVDYQTWPSRWTAIIKAHQDKAAHAPKKSGGPAPYRLALTNNGQAYSGLVFSALAAKCVDDSEASRMLGLSHDQMQKAQLRLYSTSRQSIEASA